MSVPRQRGQAAVEVVALLAALTLLGLAAAQAVTAVHAWQLAGEAARAGARAGLVGAPVAAAARGVLPAAWAGRARPEVLAAAPGVVRVRVRLVVPALLPGVGEAGWVTREAAVAR